MRHRTPIALAAALALLGVGLLSGCNLVGIVGVLGESYKRTSTRTVEAEYRGLEGRTFAVIVAADRAISGQHPALVPTLQTAMAERLRANAGAAGYVQPRMLMQFQADNPRWTAMSMGDLAEELGVDRLIFVDLKEFRLHEPGNAYLWAGATSATVGVLETDGPYRDDFAFRKAVAVKFPDDTGYGPEDYGSEYVATRLQTRIIDRVVWLFHDHQEPYYPDY